MNVNDCVLDDNTKVTQLSLFLVVARRAWHTANVSKHTDRQTHANGENSFTNLIMTAAEIQMQTTQPKEETRMNTEMH